MSVAFWILIATAHCFLYSISKEREGREREQVLRQVNFRQAICHAGDLLLSDTGVGVGMGGLGGKSPS